MKFMTNKQHRELMENHAKEIQILNEKFTQQLKYAEEERYVAGYNEGYAKGMKTDRKGIHMTSAGIFHFDNNQVRATSDFSPEGVFFEGGDISVDKKRLQ